MTNKDDHSWPTDELRSGELRLGNVIYQLLGVIFYTPKSYRSHFAAQVFSTAVSEFVEYDGMVQGGKGKLIGDHVQIPECSDGKTLICATIWTLKASPEPPSSDCADTKYNTRAHVEHFDVVPTVLSGMCYYCPSRIFSMSDALVSVEWWCAASSSSQSGSQLPTVRVGSIFGRIVATI
jgi:hypothetical protein